MDIRSLVFVTDKEIRAAEVVENIDNLDLPITHKLKAVATYIQYSHLREALTANIEKIYRDILIKSPEMVTELNDLLKEHRHNATKP